MRPHRHHNRPQTVHLAAQRLHLHLHPPYRPRLYVWPCVVTMRTKKANKDIKRSSPGHNVSQCQNDATWTVNVSYMGMSESGGKIWPYKLLPAPSAADCCGVCFDESPHGCQGWAFLPWDNTPVPCTIIYGWNTSGASKTCPHGRARIEFATDPGRSGSVGDAGPCGY
jgi:hypothetical protein